MHGCSPIFHATSLDCFQSFVDAGSDPTLKASSGRDILQSACWKRLDLRYIENLLAIGISPNSRCTKRESSPLQIAALYNNVPLLHLLLAHGALINGVDDTGDTALM